MCHFLGTTFVIGKYFSLVYVKLKFFQWINQATRPMNNPLSGSPTQISYTEY